MKKIVKEIFDALPIICLMIANMFLAFTITTALGIKNVIILQSYTTIANDITYEVLIWFVLMLMEIIGFEFMKIQAYKKVNHLNGSLAEIRKKMLEDEKKDESN